MIPASSYGKVLERIASHGYVVLGIWTLSALPMTQIHPQWLKDIDYWLQVFIHTAACSDFDSDCKRTLVNVVIRYNSL